MVVTISNPRLEGQNLTYEVKTLEGDLPKTGGAAALFIDVIIVRRAPRPTDRRVCQSRRAKSSPSPAQRAAVHGSPSSKPVVLPCEAARTLQRKRKIGSNFASLGSPPLESPASAGLLVGKRRPRTEAALLVCHVSRSCEIPALAQPGSDLLFRDDNASSGVR